MNHMPMEVPNPTGMSFTTLDAASGHSGLGSLGEGGSNMMANILCAMR
jgi:hypothetical protein